MVDISELTESVKGYIEGLQAVLQRKYQISEEKALNMITSSYIMDSLIDYPEETLHDDIEAHADNIDGHIVVVTRDMFGIAMKATYGIVNGEPIMIYKDPKTDTSHLKKSHKGCCCIYHDDNGELQCMDGFNDVFRDGVLRTVFKDGEMYHKETFEDIRERLNGGNKDE